jgi:hypothetical protein
MDDQPLIYSGKKARWLSETIKCPVRGQVSSTLTGQITYLWKNFMHIDGNVRQSKRLHQGDMSLLLTPPFQLQISTSSIYGFQPLFSTPMSSPLSNILVASEYWTGSNLEAPAWMTQRTGLV